MNTPPTLQRGRPPRTAPPDFDPTQSAKALAAQHSVSLPTIYKWLTDAGAARKTGPAASPVPPDFSPSEKIKSACVRWGVCTHTIRRWRAETTTQ